MRVAAIQLRATPGEVRVNLGRAARLATVAGEAEAKLVVFPELFAHGAVGARAADLAEPEDGPTAEFLHETAARLGCVVIGTFPLSATGGGAPRNALVLADSSGQSWRYHKAQLSKLERQWFATSPSDAVIDTSLGSVGVAVCSDVSNPELTARLATSRAFVVAVPQAVAIAAWAAQPVQWWERRRGSLMAPVARRLGKPLVVAGLVGPSPDLPRRVGRYQRGGTAVLDATGQTLGAVTTLTEGVAIADVKCPEGRGP